MIYKIAILLYIVLYSGVALGLRPYILFRNTGINPYAKLGRGGVQGWTEKILMFGAMMVPLIGGTFIFSEKFYSYLWPIQFLQIEWIKIIGIILMVLGAILCIVAQFQMGNSWRIGFNKMEQTPLITKQLYRYSRNPIYLALLVSFFGFFLIVPNALSLACLLVSYPAVEVKIRLEEAYLVEKHGRVFEDYKIRTPRWF